eukprot:TRINITY_DN8719_c0_g2_i1.p1 TRINITY_DN8719_c0_g2~~TRINITY_DN8719_c0_g2_i1.p1  ORF type:complete len:198 (-),score=17.77 TRINITY_DN8719_c0_g2_i1:92-685(-)
MPLFTTPFFLYMFFTQIYGARRGDGENKTQPGGRSGSSTGGGGGPLGSEAPKLEEGQCLIKFFCGRDHNGITFNKPIDVVVGLGDHTKPGFPVSEVEKYTQQLNTQFVVRCKMFEVENFIIRVGRGQTFTASLYDADKRSVYLQDYSVGFDYSTCEYTTPAVECEKRMEPGNTCVDFVPFLRQENEKFYKRLEAHPL